MNLNMIRPINETEDLQLSTTKNCESLIEQTHRKTEETLEFKLNKPREAFHFKPPMSIKSSWMIRSKSLEVYISIIIINHEIIKFELKTDTSDKVSFRESKGELEDILDISITTNENLQDDTIGPRTISMHKKLEIEKRRTDGYCYYTLILGYARSPFRDFQNFVRIVVGLIEDDIQWILKQYISNFVTYELYSCFYRIQDL